jgi:peroxiredoxin
MKSIKILGFAISWLLFLTANAQDNFTIVKKGEKAPAFSFELKEGKTVKLSDLKGKVILINFFATWCGPCRKELPHIDKEIYKQYKGRDDFMILTFGREHDWETVNKFRGKNNFEMPFYPDMGRKVFSKFAKQNIPRNFVIDKNGHIVYTSVGFNEKHFEELKNLIRDLLK